MNPNETRTYHPSSAQLETLVEFMERNPGMAKGFLKTQNARERSRRQWEDLTMRLNSLGGTIKTYKQWIKKYYVEIERALLHSVNPVYFEHWDMLTRRANRNAPYTLTLNFTIIRPIGNNITVHMKVYEKVNADYKLTPLEIHFRVCEWINKDKLVIPIIRRYDLHDSFGSCPLKGNVHLKDLLIRSEDAPTGFWPFVRNKLDLKYYVTATKESIVDFSLYFRVNEVPEKKKG